MDGLVKTGRRGQRRAETERRLVESASALFVERGYAGTTLADVAEHADIAPRTLYLHFPTKAELLLRCIGIAIAGDAEPIALADRPAMAEAMTAATFDERLRLMASLTASLMERTGPLLDVAFQAAPSEPSIAAAAAAGRAETSGRSGSSGTGSNMTVSSHHRSISSGSPRPPRSWPTPRPTS